MPTMYQPPYQGQRLQQELEFVAVLNPGLTPRCSKASLFRYVYRFSTIHCSIEMFVFAVKKQNKISAILFLQSIKGNWNFF